MLEAHVETNLANYEYELTPETGGIVRSFGISGDVTNEDEVFNPSDGRTIMYGAHFSEVFEAQLSSVIEGANGALKGAQITQAIELATDLSIAGHPNNAVTVVTTGLGKTHEFGRFAEQETRVKVLPFD